MNIVLIGFMGAGKSAVAKLFTGMECVDMDALVYLKTHTKNMHEVFALGGELLLRETEILIAKEIAHKKNVVIATGGGVVLNQIIFTYFKKEGARIVYLRADFATLAQRLEADISRPLFSRREEAKKLYDLRAPLYEYYADLIIDANKAPELIAMEIKGKINGF